MTPIRFATIWLLGILALLFVPASNAYAQACCGAAQSTGIGRVAMGQTYFVGVDLQYRNYYGRYGTGEHIALQDGITELRETLIAAARPIDPLQIGLAIPFMQTYKSYTDLSEFGGGLADISMHLRYEVIPTGLYRTRPGIGIYLTGKFPTGRATADSIARNKTVLQTDTTGTGSYDIGAALQVEWPVNAWFFAAMAGIQQPIPHTNALDNVIQRYPQWQGSLSMGYAFRSNIFEDGRLYSSLALSTDYNGGYKENHRYIQNSQERRTSLRAQVGGYLTPFWFAGIHLTNELPIAHLGENLYTGTTAGFFIRRVFYD